MRVHMRVRPYLRLRVHLFSHTDTRTHTGFARAGTF